MGILLISAMSSDQLAVGNDDGYNVECNLLYLHTDDNDSDIKNDYAYYSDFCLNVDSDVSWEDYWDDTTSVDWCDTWRGAAVWISCVVFSCLAACLGTCWVQPFCVMDRCCCSRMCPKIFFVLAIILSVMGNVVWTTDDRVCLDEDAFDLSLGRSVHLVIGATVLLFVVL